jgi:putative methyltransferase (TIGR04325 family)
MGFGMNLIENLHGTVDALSRTGYFRERAHQRALQTFLANRDQNLFFDTFQTYTEAAVAAQKLGVTGYDNEASAAIYDHYTRIDTHDYPALCWLMRSMQEGMRTVADVGGSIGIKYRAFQVALAPWPDLRWTVHDVPAAVAHGRALAAERSDTTRLHFADRFDDLEGTDVLFASGVLQYLPETLGVMLARWQRLPRRIVINITPIHPQRDFFTINSIGTAFCPYRVQTQASLVRGLTQLGYKPRESWINPDKVMVIPLQPESSLRHYSGYCLDRAG